MKTALLVIDVQHALCTGEYAAFEADQMINRINAISKKARVARVPVIFIQHEEDEDLLEFGSPGWQLARGLVALEGDIYIRKTAPDSFHQTGLDAALRQLGIVNVVICGLQSEYCVDSTTRRALALGYQVVLVADAHSTMDTEILSASQISRHHTHTLAHLTSFGPRVRAIPASDVTFAA
jgi:nicotinamidase-related amidase